MSDQLYINILILIVAVYGSIKILSGVYNFISLYWFYSKPTKAVKNEKK